LSKLKRAKTLNSHVNLLSNSNTTNLSLGRWRTSRSWVSTCVSLPREGKLIYLVTVVMSMHLELAKW